MAKGSSTSRTLHLKLFGAKIPLSGAMTKSVQVFGIRIPVAGIAIVVALSLVGFTIWGIVVSRAPKQISQPVQHRYAIADPQFARAMGALLGPPLISGNRALTLINGDEIFPAMLAAIGSAKKTITFESYIYWSGSIGKRFADALAERARHGVKVHLLLDWLGSHKMDQESIDEMGRAGVEVIKFHRPQFYHFRHLNHRTHRKLLVIDGAVGFTGGVGIADQWSGNAQDEHHWRDTHFRVEGPVVAQLQAAFTDNWTKMTGAVLHGDDYFPALTSVGPLSAQMFKSSIEGGAESMQLMYLLSIAAAARSIDLSMAYFIPDGLTIDHLVAALKRGVRVRLILPGSHNDSRLVQWASRAKWGHLLAAGAEIYEYQPTMYHCKVLVVDELWVSVGSTNFDTRSFRLNGEANLNIYEREFAARQSAIFENDLKRSRRITYQEWLDRAWYQKAADNLVVFFDPQL
ncbi:MAG TPA: phospholipase D-like domain-containing protein [Usitatibacter sp.]|nr:phospholipase D-like domain-containing protein [Usitatibacter sp.]